MKVLARFVDDLTSRYVEDHRYAEKYPGSWIDHSVRNLTYVELGELLDDLFPLIEECSFDIGGKLDGHSAFENLVDEIVEQVFVKFGVIPQSPDSNGNNTIHVGRLALIKKADPKLMHELET
jgi:hypothetical protein